MKNKEYNSLTEKLIQSGILQANNDNPSDDINIFNVKNFPEESAIENTQEINSEAFPDLSRKRINNYDLALLENTNAKTNVKAESNIEKFIYKIFPKLYEFKIAKDAIQKMAELGIDTNALLNKSVPYGENEIRYKNLVKFIKYANEIQTKLKEKSKAK